MGSGRTQQSVICHSSAEIGVINALSQIFPIEAFAPFKVLVSLIINKLDFFLI